MNFHDDKQDPDTMKVDTQATTAFIDNAETEIVEPVNHEEFTDDYHSYQESNVVTSISQFLAKPIEILTGQLAATDTAATFGTNFVLPYDMVSHPVYYPKLRGYLGFRATMVFTLQVNAQRFQQGRYMLVYVPTAGTHTPGHTEPRAKRHWATLTSRTQCPRVEIDINTQTSVQLRVPFSSAYDFYPLQWSSAATSSKWGRMRLFPYVPLQTGDSSNTAKFTLWAHFEDVELVGQAVPVELQSNSSRKKGKSATAKEQESKDMGPIQSASKKVGKVLTILEKVPLINRFVEPLEWANDIVGGIASVFGWSSPANLDKQYRIETSIMSYATNVSKPDKTNPMSYMPDNQVQVLSGLAFNGMDEMHIPYLAQIFSYQGFFNWTTVAAEEALLARYYVGLYPNGAPLTHVDGTNTFTDLTPAQFLGTRFSMWRGTVKMRFKFIKTEFHSGRLSIDFNPEAPNYVSPALSDAVAPYLHRQIIDVRTMSEIVLEFPYVHPNPYRNTYNNGETHFGTIEIRVIDPVVAPDTAAQVINVLVEHCLGEDAEFAGHTGFGARVYETLEVQSNSVVIGGTQSNTGDITPAKFCIGERVSSLRALAKRYEPIEFITGGLGTFGVGNYQNTDYAQLHTVIPFGLQTEGLSVLSTTQDLYSLLGHIYVYSRGGVRLKMIPYGARRYTNATATSEPTAGEYYYATVAESRSINAINMRNSAYDTLGTIGARQPIPATFLGNTGQTQFGHYQVVQVSRDTEMAIQIPQAHRQHSRMNITHTCSNETYKNYATDETAVQYVAVYRQNITDGTPAEMPGFGLKVYRAAADDANFSLFVSIPPMVIAYQVGITFP